MKKYLDYCGFSISEEKFIGFTVLYGFALFLCFSLLFWFLNIKQIYAFVIWVLFEIFMHASLILVADSRANFAEEILPDVLSLFSSNIRSGLTPDKALMLAARPEFGPLEEEIRRASKKTLSGESIEGAIKTIPERINSKTLDRTVKLLSEGISKGGSLQNLLDGLANDIRESRLIKKEISAQVMIYAIFIFFAVGIGAPILFAASNHLIESMGTISKNINIDHVAIPTQIPLKIQKIDIEKSFLIKYSLACLTITSIFGGMLIGMIKDGSEKAGLKYIPI
ncbi:MAG: type II secretion system F family protein, partial [Candidatus Aenigmarchaeota archaeon]|nr:type II secretion system F family protein [Candidatus Aenigmarchaeota archaeon]